MGDERRRRSRPRGERRSASATKVTIGEVTYTIRKLDNGNIRVNHPSGQAHPMQGADTDGVHVFEVHPCQSRWYAYWNDHLPPAERDATGPGRDGEKPWWSSKSWKKREKGNGNVRKPVPAADTGAGSETTEQEGDEVTGEKA